VKYEKSQKLSNVCYDIRGPVLKEAVRLEEEGYRITKLNIGNPAPFGFNAPDEILHDIIVNLLDAQGYCESKGLFSARKAIMQDWQKKSVMDVETEDIYIGNGVSELITMSMQAMVNNGDEVLIPSPDYPLWTAAVHLAGGKAVHYRCDEESDWYPDLEHIKSLINSRTKALVIINPNNPTGAVYSKELLEGIVTIAKENSLFLLADEIYEKITYDEAKHIPLALIAGDQLCLSFSGLSKGYRAAGFRAGWLTLTGDKRNARDFIEGLDILANMRLCANVPSQFGIQTALGGYQSVNDLVLPGGRLRAQRDIAYELLTQIPGVSCVKPRGALYCFPKLDVAKFSLTNDVQFALDLLKEKKILIVQGTGFNWKEPDHFRLVFLPQRELLELAVQKIGDFLSGYSQNP
jgi:alanine-synthesizing transaminase